MKVYRGRRFYSDAEVDQVSKGQAVRGTTKVTVEERGRALKLNPRLDLRNHSPTGLEWGYSGSGPAQLALAILADCVSPERALHDSMYQRFKAAVVSSLPHEEWTLTAWEVLQAVQRIEEESNA